MIGVNLVRELGLESSTLKRFKDSSGADETSRVVMEYVLKGWPSKKEKVDEPAREYWNFRKELSVEDGKCFKSDRTVVPRPLRDKVLDKIHGAHMGESKSLSFAPRPVLLASTLITVSLLLSKYANTGALVMTDFSLLKAS